MLTAAELDAKYGANHIPATVRERDRYFRDAYGLTYDEVMGENYGGRDADRLECENYFECGYDDVPDCF